MVHPDILKLVADAEQRFRASESRLKAIHLHIAEAELRIQASQDRIKASRALLQEDRTSIFNVSLGLQPPMR
jgi:division protein CdvB (Snf7/Vps24/ESCRT-III family)